MKNINDKKITIVKEDDWAGIYIDGEITAQDRESSIPLEEFAEILGVKVDVKWADADWLYEKGCLPDKLEDVKFE